MIDSNTPTITVPGWDGEPYEVHPRLMRYSNGRLAIEFWSEAEWGPEPFAKLTVNLPDQHLNEGEIFVKDWAENSLLVETLLEVGWLEHTGREVISGYVAPQVMRPAASLKEYIDQA